mgnify:CR=1 FL=1
MGGEIFEAAQRLRGFEKLMSDFFRNPELVDYLFSQLVSIAAQSVSILARAGVDIICLDDDVGEPSRMMIGRDLWRRFLKNPLAQIISTARPANPAVKILYHSDGYIEPIIQDLIEIGVDVLNPLQPAAMDLEKLSRRYGEHLSFWGSIDIQHTLPFGRPEEVVAEVRQRVRTLGRSGGLILGPTHNVQLDTPLENFWAMVNAILRTTYGSPSK